MSSGKDFVEAMARLGYPGASSLESSEFDWLFTGPPENLPFLNFVCRGLNRHNVLTPEEVRAFDELQKSGKPILAQEALDELLKTVPPSEVDRPSAEGRTMEDLEAELQALRKEKKQKQQRLKMLEAAAASRADVAVSLSSHLDGVSSRLTEAKSSLVAENGRANAGLQSLANQVGELTRRLLANPRESLPFQRFATCPGDLAENFCSEQVPDPNREKNQVEETRTQLARLMQAHVVVQRQLAEAVAEEKSIEAGLRWLSNKSSSVQSLGDLSSLQMYEGEYRKKLRAAKAETEALFVGPLSLALCESARLIAVAPVKADHSLELTRLGHITLWQNQLRDKLLCQKAASDILHLAQQMESRKWKECLEHLGDMSGRLVGIREDASLALGCPELAVNVKPNPVVGSRDATFARLMQILDQESSRERAEPFLTYEAVERAAAGLSDNLRAGRESLGAAARERRGATAGLEDHCEALDEAVSTELGQLVLGPKLSLKAIAGQELLCANAKEVKEKLSEADLRLQLLLKRIQEFSGNVNSMRSRLARDPLLASERNVYTRFHTNAAALRKAVEDLERKPETRGKPSQQEARRDKPASFKLPTRNIHVDTKCFSRTTSDSLTHPRRHGNPAAAPSARSLARSVRIRGQRREAQTGSRRFFFSCFPDTQMRVLWKSSQGAPHCSVRQAPPPLRETSMCTFLRVLQFWTRKNRKSDRSPHRQKGDSRPRPLGVERVRTRQNKAKVMFKCRLPIWFLLDCPKAVSQDQW